MKLGAAPRTHACMEEQGNSTAEQRRDIMPAAAPLTLTSRRNAYVIPSRCLGWSPHSHIAWRVSHNWRLVETRSSVRAKATLSSRRNANFTNWLVDPIRPNPVGSSRSCGITPEKTRHSHTKRTLLLEITFGGRRAKSDREYQPRSLFPELQPRARGTFTSEASQF